MSAQKGMNNKTKRNGSSKSKKKVEFEKGKVYIPAYKMIIFCACVIAVCITLLLISALKAKDSYRPVKEISKIEKPQSESKKETKIVSEQKKIEKKQEKKSEPKSESKKTENSKQKDNIQNKEQSKKEIQKAEKTRNDTVTIKPNQAASEKKNEIQDTKKTEISAVKPAEKTSEQKTKETQKTTPVETVKETPKTDPKPIESGKIDTKTDEVKTEITQQEPSKKSYNFPPAKNNAQLIFLFDDGGQNLNHLKPFLELPFPITIAVLPKLSYSVESAKRIRASEHELMLHQPMQAINDKVNPGPGAIKPDMSESEIMSILFQNINEIGPIAGFNNHEGSAITADAEKMEIIMKMAAENGIFFLDSRTNKDTQVPYVAKEMGYSYYERNGYFLDNEKTKENALKELRRNLDIANKTGSVIMIGHIWSADFLPEFLMEVYPELKEKGYTFTTVSKSKAKKN